MTEQRCAYRHNSHLIESVIMSIRKVNRFFFRYLAITKPMSYDEEKVRRRLPYIFITIWILSFIVLLPVYIESGIEDGACRLTVFDTLPIGLIIYTFWLFMFCLIPSSIMLYTYVIMFKMIRETTKSLSTSTQRTKTMKNAQMNVMQTCIIVGVFFMCTMTFLKVTDALVILKVLGFHHSLWNASVISIGFNSCINPFVYTLR